MNNLSDLIGEYTTSEHFLFVDATLKPHAESLLGVWCTSVGAEISASSMDMAFKKTASMNLPTDARKAAPSIVKGFLEFVAATGRNPQAGSLIETVMLLEKRYADSFRDDGTVRGETFKKKYTDVGRNDPCPCGSGKKFKQCCMKLIG